MIKRRCFLIIGNGIAGASAADVLRTEDRSADIVVVADDPYPVYYRPALKDYLAGKIREDKLWARPINFYPDRNIQFLTDTVVAIHPQDHSIQLRSGRMLHYTRLLLAHGARSSTLTCPGAHLSGVNVLRTVADYQQVLSRLNQVRRVVVTGSGTLALESIETLRHRGFQVTHLLRRRTLWSEVLDPIASDLVLQQEQRDGVEVRYEQEIAEIIGNKGNVSAVVTTKGENIPCEMVLQGIGITPITDFVEAAGIACGRGVKVDNESMSTNMPDIYAAGDLIETNDPITGKARVIGQWYPAIQQAKAAAYSMLDMLDKRHRFRFGNFYNATFLYGLDFASVGLSNIPKGGQDFTELQSDPLPRHYQKVILKAGVPVGMLGIGDRSTVLAFKRAIDHEVNLSSLKGQLLDPGFKLATWLDQQGIPPAILGVKKELKAEPTKKVPVIKALPSEAPPLTVAETPVPVRGAVSQSDGSLLLPGDNASLSPKLFKKLSQGPALVLVRPDASQVFPLAPAKRILIGRDTTCDIQIRDVVVSRQHAEVFHAPDGFYIHDLGSSNGVWINQTRIDNTYRLSGGDCITLSKNIKIYFTVPHQPPQTLAQVTASLASNRAPASVSPQPARTHEKTCGSCGTIYPLVARFCAQCGNVL